MLQHQSQSLSGDKRTRLEPIAGSLTQYELNFNVTRVNLAVTQPGECPCRDPVPRSGAKMANVMLHMAWQIFGGRWGNCLTKLNWIGTRRREITIHTFQWVSAFHISRFQPNCVAANWRRTEKNRVIPSEGRVITYFACNLSIADYRLKKRRKIKT